MGAMLVRAFCSYPRLGFSQAVLLVLVGILVAISYMILLTTWQQQLSSLSSMPSD